MIEDQTISDDTQTKKKIKLMKKMTKIKSKEITIHKGKGKRMGK